jgi:exodeoxyribonuclease VII large subunit
MKVEALQYGDRKVFSVAGFNRGVASWLGRLPTLWVEGEVTELRRQQAWQSVFLTLKDPESGACLPVTMPRGTFDALQLELRDGERVHVYGRPELFEAKADFRLRALSIERFGLGAHLAALERLKRKLAAEGLFDPARKRPLPRLPRTIGLVTGNDAAAKRDVLTAITGRFPPARIVVAETFVQGPKAAGGIVAALRALCAQPDVDVIIVARGGGSFEDLLAFSDESVVRAIAACAVPVVSAVGHEQDTPLCDLAADVRASTPSVAGRLVVPELAALLTELARDRAVLDSGLARMLERRREQLAARRTVLDTGLARLLERRREQLSVRRAHLRRAPLLLVERRRAALEAAAGRLRTLSPQATLERGYAIVRTDTGVVRAAAALAPGGRVDVRLAEGSFGASIEEVRP